MTFSIVIEHSITLISMFYLKFHLFFPSIIAEWCLWQQTVVFHRYCLPKQLVMLHNMMLQCQKWHRRMCSFPPSSASISSSLWRLKKLYTKHNVCFFPTASSQNRSIPTLRTFLLLCIFCHNGYLPSVAGGYTHQSTLNCTTWRPRLQKVQLWADMHRVTLHDRHTTVV